MADLKKISDMANAMLYKSDLNFLMEFLTWMDKMNATEPMKLETDNDDIAMMFLDERNKSNSDRAVSYADAEATLKHIILGGIADGYPTPEKQVDEIAKNLFKPETFWCIKMLMRRHSA